MVWAAATTRASHRHPTMNPWLEQDDSCYRGLGNALLYRRSFSTVREESKWSSQETLPLVSRFWCQGTKWRLPKGTAKCPKAEWHWGVDGCSLHNSSGTPTWSRIQGQTPGGYKSPGSGAERYISQTKFTKAFWNKRAIADGRKNLGVSSKCRLWTRGQNADKSPWDQRCHEIWELRRGHMVEPPCLNGSGRATTQQHGWYWLPTT